jgi:hypothetical protein
MKRITIALFTVFICGRTCDEEALSEDEQLYLELR